MISACSVFKRAGTNNQQYVFVYKNNIMAKRTKKEDTGQHENKCAH